ncbi:class B sortase [Butyrivibrio sp. YAB3001]|uniref:class B sortase n=1 Tax=Butyrivibrio sp. YAB3001 TaxID=1520812 RepID=UPI0008F667C9|nr:class B sortase [Butyrivibrio sp. YAB3001]SFB71065.1 sortase B [Butyrivibrio sp. YAB3001]
MNHKVFKFIRIIAIIICLGIIAYESYKIYDDQKEYAVADEEYEEIESQAVVWPTKEDESEVIDYPLIQIDFDKLEAINPDVVAWIYFPCLDISYPVVKENEVDEYIHLTFDKQVNKAGCIYEDVLSDPEFRGMHDIVFGHNMKNKSMFGKLKMLYQDENKELLEKNPYVYVYTKDYVFQYRVFGYYITKVGSEAYKVVETNDTYDEFLEYIQLHSAYPRPQEADFSQRPSLLTLSTCSGASGSGKRFVVHTYKSAAWIR